MKYKAGDRVRIKSIDWYYDNRDRIDEVECGNTNFIPDMVKYCGGIVTISSVLPTLEVYHIKEDGGMFNWTDEMIEGLVEEETCIGINIYKDGYIHGGNVVGNEITLPQGYQFVDENGNVINARKIVLEKKKKEYPKTYEECCKILDWNHRDYDRVGYKSELLCKLQVLLLCRDAYWRIAGEEMGLGKPWAPDWEYDDTKYILFFNKNEICYEMMSRTSFVLAFPTEEMRDAFYENFKSEIESCKELL